MAISKGDKAPNFSLEKSDGTPFVLEEALKTNVVVLFFYPKDDTPICTAEACAFRDSHEAFLEKGAMVVGISSDDKDSHESFAKKHGLPYVLLSDIGDKVRKAYGATSMMGLVPGRVTYVIDQQGIVQMAFSSQLSSTGHMEKALETVASLSK